MIESLPQLLEMAYGLEKKSLRAIRLYLASADTPEAQKRIEAHLLETQWQIKLLDTCLEFYCLGINSPAAAEDLQFEPQTDVPDLLTIKKYEIALYKNIIAEARKQNATEILQACREIIAQERTMAEWIEDNDYSGFLMSSMPKSVYQATA